VEIQFGETAAGALTCVSAPIFPGGMVSHAASGAPSLGSPDLPQSIITLVALPGIDRR
jgi:hypothetical protein